LIDGWAIIAAYFCGGCFSISHGALAEGTGLSTVDLLLKLACFLKQIKFALSKAKDLN
jgi:hypothetical protein